MKNIMRFFSSPISDQDREAIIQTARQRILELCSPERIILFGSGLSQTFDSYSDLDFIIIFQSEKCALEGQKMLYRNTNLFPCAVDFICTDIKTFNRKSQIGGVMMIAAEEGRVLQDNSQIAVDSTQ